MGAPGLAGNRLSVLPEVPPVTPCCFPQAADSDGSSQLSFASEHRGSQPWSQSTGICAAQALGQPAQEGTLRPFCSGGAGGGGSGHG